MRKFASTSSALPLRATRVRGQAGLPSARLVSRSVHTLPRLPYPVEGGVGKFLSPKALRTIAIEYQGGLLERLNELVKDTDLENKSVVTTVINLARNQDQVLAFNAASQALNNSFFLDNLAPPVAPATNHEAALNQQFHHAIRDQFGSLAQLKSNFSAAANGMMTSGWVWLVVDSHKRLAIVSTYGSGTVIVRSRHQMLPPQYAPSVERLPNSSDNSSVSFNHRTPSHRASALSSNSPPLPNSVPVTNPFDAQGQTRQYSALSPSSPALAEATSTNQNLFDASGEVTSRAAPQTTNGGKIGVHPHNTTGAVQFVGDKLTPLFCLSVHEHAWLYDYGVLGKEEYLARFWDALDWGRVGRIHYDVAASF